jgi:hypothetical protein
MIATRTRDALQRAKARGVKSASLAFADWIAVSMLVTR